jgi:hypothetical protein
MRLRYTYLCLKTQFPQSKISIISNFFLDYKKAYDSVPHSWLIKILKIYKINLELINFLSHVMTFWRTTG